MMKSSVFRALVGLAMLGIYQAPALANDIVFLSSKTSATPLQYAGANSPYFAGMSFVMILRDS